MALVPQDREHRSRRGVEQRSKAQSGASLHDAAALALTKANLGLALNSLEALMQAREHWLALGVARLHDAFAHTQSAAEQLACCNDWQALAALPNNTYWRILDRQVGAWQSMMQTSVAAQTDCRIGMQRALSIWQRDVARAIGAARDAMPLRTLLQAWLPPAYETNGR